jgi:hypothetical protein
MTNTQITRLLISFVIAVAALFAQGDRGTITGSVTDQAGGAIPGARVTVTNTSTGVKLTRNSKSARSNNRLRSKRRVPC